jgi:peroxiredoxin
MKEFFIALFFTFTFLISLNAQSNSNELDNAAIKQAALDYADGFYSGDVARMERAILPDLNKAYPATLPQSANVVLNYSTYSALIELTRARVGLLEEDKRKLSVAVLNIKDDIANAKVLSAKFNDYLQLVKIDGQWKIINVLWTPGSNTPPRIKDFKLENEKSAIIKTVQDYVEGIFSGDTKRIELAVHPEFNKVLFNKMQNTGKISFRKQKFSTIDGASFAKVGMVDEPKRDIQYKIIDAMDGLAVVEIYTGANYEYVQMFKDGDNNWKIFNTIVKQNSNVSFSASLPPVVGEQMPDFTLPIYGGGDFSLSKQKGKNILLVFLRGWLGNSWCQICQFEYAEMVELQKELNLKKKYDLEIAFVLPYNVEKVADFVDKIPDGVQKVEKYKIAAADANLPQKELAEFANRKFKHSPELENGKTDIRIPILIDSEQTLSKRMKVYTTFWDQVKSEQNIPLALIIDKNGKIVFKYLSQTTLDRPGSDYLINYIKSM